MENNIFFFIIIIDKGKFISVISIKIYKNRID